MKRRDFLAGLTAGGLLTRPAHAYAPYPVKFRLAPPHAPALAFIEAGSDEFTGEKAALQLEHRLSTLVRGGALPLAKECRGSSPAPRSYMPVAEGVSRAVFGAVESIAQGWTRWRASLGEVRSARFYALPGNSVRFDIRALRDGRLEHRTGVWRVEWHGDEAALLEPVEETLVRGREALVSRRDRACIRAGCGISRATGAGCTLLAGAPGPRLRSGCVRGEWRCGRRYRRRWP
ncbi:MAG: hypothetical protein QM757_06195 [Paludibaculum sp.]